MKMIILFGIRRKASRLGVVFMMCSSCHTPAAHSITRVRKYFTLFFIPLIPLGDKFATSCTMCGYGARISKEAADHYVSMAQQAVPGASTATEMAGPSTGQSSVDDGAVAPVGDPNDPSPTT
jgi:hypothetical protein